MRANAIFTVGVATGPRGYKGIPLCLMTHHTERPLHIDLHLFLTVSVTCSVLARTLYLVAIFVTATFT